MKSILLVEDDKSLNQGIALKLKKEGYRVETMVIVTSGNAVENRIDADAEVKAGEKIFETK